MLNTSKVMTWANFKRGLPIWLKQLQKVANQPADTKKTISGINNLVLVGCALSLFLFAISATLGASSEVLQQIPVNMIVVAFVCELMLTGIFFLWFPSFCYKMYRKLKGTIYEICLLGYQPDSTQ